MENAGRQDHRRREQEREPGRVLAGQPAEHAGHHRDAVAADAREQSENLRGADQQGFEVVPLGQALVRFAGRLRSLHPGRSLPGGVGRHRPGALALPRFPLLLKLGVGLLGPLRPEALARVQDEPVDDQEDSRPDGLAEQHPELVIEEQPGQADRDRRDDQHPGQLLVGRRDIPLANGTEEAGDDAHPVAPEINHDADGGGHMQADDKGQVRRLRCGHVEISGPTAPDEGRDQDVVPQAGDREQLGDALNEPDDNGLEVRHVGHGQPLVTLEPPAQNLGFAQTD